MTRPTLLVVTDSYLPRWDGVARVLKEVLPLLGHAFEIHLAFPDYPGPRPELPGVTYVPFPLLPILRTTNIGLPLPLRSRITAEVRWADLVWTHTAAPIGGACIREAVRSNTPVVSMIHSVEWAVYGQNFRFGKALAERTWRRMARARYNQVQKIITPSSTTKDALVSNGIIPPISVVPLGVSLSRFRPLSPEQKLPARAALGLPTSLPLVGYLGRFSDEKGLTTLLEAHELAQERWASELVLVGGYPKQLRGLSRYRRVTVVEPTDEPELYYQVMDLYVLPSQTESFPLGILEAMACGVPPLSTPVGAVPTYLLSGENGVLFPSGDASALAQILNELLPNPQLQRRLGEQARKTVEEGFSWEQAALRIEGHLKEVV